MQKEPEKTAKNWMMTNHPIQMIPNFETRWYLKNAQWDNRLQVNMPLSKHVKSQTQVNFIQDRQRQNTFNSNSFYSNASFIQQNDSSLITYKPVLLNIQQTMIWSIDSAKELKVSGNYWGDFSTANQYNQYLQNGIRSYLNSSISNNWQSFSVAAQYTHRISSTKAQEISVEINHQKLLQEGNGLSQQWRAIFSIPDQRYNKLIQQINTPVNVLNARWKLYSKKKGAIAPEITFSHVSANLHNIMYLTDAMDTTSKAYPAGFNNQGYIR